MVQSSRQRIEARRGRPVGTITRGTTNANRLRRVDRYCAAVLAPALWASRAPVVVDLGFGALPVTSLEMIGRLRRIAPDVRLVGLEIDPARVVRARTYAASRGWTVLGRERPGLAAARAGASGAFLLGGFEVPVPDGWGDPSLIRAFNVLRQYDEGEVARAWASLVARLAPGGRVVEGTCDEIGRLASWVTLDASGPRELTVSVALEHLRRPSEVAERLPKALIHRNVPGERVHAWLAALDHAWDVAAPLGVHGARQRWVATVAAVRAAGWPVRHRPRRWRLGEVSVAWDAVRPAG